jgi:hypothetical protein
MKLLKDITASLAKSLLGILFMVVLIIIVQYFLNMILH